MITIERPLLDDLAHRMLCLDLVNISHEPLLSITVTVYLNSHSIAAGTVHSIRSCRFSLEILDPDAAPLAQARPCVVDAAQKARVVFEAVIEPVVLGGEADQHSGRFATSGDDDLLGLGFAQQTRQVTLDFRQRNRLTPDFRIALATPPPPIWSRSRGFRQLSRKYIERRSFADPKPVLRGLR